MKIIRVLVALAILCSVGAANAASFTGKFYDTGGRQGGGSPLTDSLTDTLNFLGTNPTPTATFQSSGINYGGPAPYTFTTVSAFLGSDASTLDPLSTGTESLLGSVIVLTGTISLNAGINEFDVFSDDGFRLTVGGQEIGSFEGLRAPSSSVFNYDAGAGGNTDFELVWFEGSRTQAALIVELNNEIITAVPIPAALPLFGSLLLALALFNSRKRR